MDDLHKYPKGYLPKMTTYSQILTAFKAEGVENEKKLASILSQSPETGESPYRTRRHYPELKTRYLIQNLSRGLGQIAVNLNSFYDEIGGIQQFSLNVDSRISEDNIKKALFLSRTATVFTEHLFGYDEYYPDDASDWMKDEKRIRWAMSHDFVRDVFRFREPIEQGHLIILPRAIAYEGGVLDVNATLLSEMEATRVFNLGVDDRLVDQIVARYKLNHQLISLPELSVPWIKGIDLATILKIKADNRDSMDSWQRKYHKLTMTHIENHREINFAKISRQITEDLITPELAKIEKNYSRIISRHRSLALAGAATALIPVGGVILSKALLDQIFASDIMLLIPSAVASLVASVATNRINQEYTVQALDDNEFYVLWKMKRRKAV
jgi:hypothetical protein